MKHFDCTARWIRGVICGTIKFRKCPACDNDGIEWQAFDKDGEPCSSDCETAERSTCEICDGIAFIEIPN